MKRAISILTSIICLSSVAGISFIDADGVTDIGGTPDYARMLPRTGADGRIDVSLLPSSPAWTPTPVPNLYYASAASPSGGNGSQQYPFNTLAASMAVAAPRSATVVFAPGEYSGSFAVGAEKSPTICGSGYSTYISSMSLTVTGTVTTTELRICCARVGLLSINGGGKINIRLLGSTITTLNAQVPSNVTITRMDLGSTVGNYPSTCQDTYTGYPRVPQASSLVGNGKALTIVGDRAELDSSTVAFTSDVVGATNAFTHIIDTLRSADTELGERIDDEESARGLADSTIYSTIGASTNAINSRIDGIGTSWSSQISALSVAVGSLSTSVGTLAKKETNDVMRLSGDIDQVRADFIAADTTVLSTANEHADDAVSGLEARVEGIARPVASSVVTEATPSIVAQAYTNSKTYTDSKIYTLANRITALETWKTTINGYDLKAKINAIIGCLNHLKNGGQPSDMSVPDYIP